MTFLFRSALPKKAFVAFLTVALLAFATPRPAHAWWAAGHAIIAMMAYRQMKPETRARVDQTLRSHPDYKNWLAELPANVTPAQQGEYVFAIASTWPDRIKDAKDQTVGVKFYEPGDKRNPPPVPFPSAPTLYPDLNAHGKWHYYDTPINADGKERAAPSEESVLTALPLCRGNIASPLLPASYRAYYLAWLVHLVGDIHQPLHTASRFSSAQPTGDGGGNGVRFKTGPNSTSAERNLHSFWDSLLGSGPDPKRYNTLQNGWDELNATITAIDSEAPRLLAGFDQKSQNNLDEKQWLRESFFIAQDFVYTFGDVDGGSGPNPLPSSEYKAFALRIAHQRAALAARRLALICDTAFAAQAK